MAVLVDDLAKTTNRSSEWQKSLDEFATNRMELLKDKLLKVKDRQTLFLIKLQKYLEYQLKIKREVLEVVGTVEGSFIKKGQTVQDVVDVKKYKSVTDAFLETSTDYRAIVTDTFMQTAKQVYSKQFFDRLADTGLESGLLFKSANDAVAKGLIQITYKWSFG